MPRTVLLALVMAFVGAPMRAAPLQAEPSSRAALPRFSPTGLDANAYGEAEGYPVGTRLTFTDVRYLVGAFTHFDQLFPTHVIARAATPWLFRRAEREATVSYLHNGVRASLQDYLAHNPITGLLIAKDDTILFEHYHYGRTESDRFLSQSMGKSLTAMLIGIAIGERAIDSIDDAAADYVAELEGTEYGKTSIRDLLTMSSGVKFSENYGGQDDDEKLEVELLTGTGDRSTAAIIAQFDTRAAPAGTKWNYGAPEPLILGLVLKHATKMSVADFMRAKIWQPMGAEADATWIVDGAGDEMTHGFVSATLRDWARLGRLLAHDGIWQGRELIPRQWVLDATTVASDSYRAPGRLIQGFPLGYGYLIWILPGPRRQFALLGTRGQAVFVDPRNKLVMVHSAVRKHFTEPWDEALALWAAVTEQLE